MSVALSGGDLLGVQPPAGDDSFFRTPSVSNLAFGVSVRGCAGAGTLKTGVCHPLTMAVTVPHCALLARTAPGQFRLQVRRMLSSPSRALSWWPARERVGGSAAE